MSRAQQLPLTLSVADSATLAGFGALDGVRP